MILKKKLPQRPNLDHLRRQAKSLLAGFAEGDAEAITLFQTNLPALKGKSIEAIRAMTFRLADAQFAIARQTGFASWPKLAQHVEQLRSLEGAWSFEHLEVDGTTMSSLMTQLSRILIDGDRFRTESPGATYEGIFNINVEADPAEIDIDFIAGPESGNRNLGIFRLSGDQLEICLDMVGNTRPTQFTSLGGKGRAYEKLRRTSQTRPENVTGGHPPTRQASAGLVTSSKGFEYQESELLKQLQGDWTALKIVRDGQELPPMMLRTARREATMNEVKISFGGQVMIHALMRIDETTLPIRLDYFHLDGAAKDMIQLGVMKLVDGVFHLNMASPGDSRPEDFANLAGSGRTLSQWVLRGRSDR